jgi:RNA recognition motif-containing protein
MSPNPAAQQANLPGRPGSFAPNFQPPPNFANINFNAPVIRLGTMGSAKDGGNQGGERGDGNQRRGLGMEHQRPRENATLNAPTREEVMRTLFIGKIPLTMLDLDLETVLRSAGSLRKWTRAFDAENKPCTFGFAEYEDAVSLQTAIEILPDIEVPVVRQEMKSEKTEESDPVESVRLLVRISWL